MYPLPFAASFKGTISGASLPFTTFELGCFGGAEIRFLKTSVGVCGDVSTCNMTVGTVSTPGSQIPACAEGTVDCGVPIVKTERESVESFQCHTLQNGNLTVSGTISDGSHSNSLAQRGGSEGLKSFGICLAGQVNGSALLVSKNTFGPNQVMSMSDNALSLCTDVSNATGVIASRGTVTVSGTSLGAFSSYTNSTITTTGFQNQVFSYCA